MVRTPPVNRLPNNATNENDIMMTPQQAHNLKMAQTASDGFRFPQSTDIVDDDEQTVQDVLAEINAETNREQMTQQASQMQQQQQAHQTPVQMMQIPPQPVNMQPPSALPPMPHHIQQQAMGQMPPQPTPSYQQVAAISNGAYGMDGIPYDMMMNHGQMTPSVVEPYQEKSYINRIIELITSNVKIFLILTIIIISLRLPIVRNTIAHLTQKYLPIPYIEVLIDIVLAYIVYLTLSSKAIGLG